MKLEQIIIDSWKDYIEQMDARRYAYAGFAGECKGIFELWKAGTEVKAEACMLLLEHALLTLNTKLKETE